MLLPKYTIMSIAISVVFLSGCSLISPEYNNDDLPFGDTVMPENVPEVVVESFKDCMAAGNPVMESYPRQCRHEGEVFVEDVGNIIEKQDLIRLTTPQPQEIIESPLEITGEARGTWFFEANFPVVLTNWDGLIIAEGYAAADGEWMTEEFVPFTATLEFEKPSYGERGTLILQKANPSDFRELDDALEIPVSFGVIAQR